MRWLDLGDALGQQGSVRQGFYCMERVAELGRSTASALIDSGDYYLRHGEPRVGLPLLSQALKLTSERDDVIFSIFVARQASIGDVLAYGIPPEQAPAQSFLRYLVSAVEGADDKPALNDVKAVWAWLAARHLTGTQLARDYAAFLWRQKLYSDARDAWMSQPAARPAGYFTRQFLYNGDFEQDLASRAGPFDWSVEPANHVEVLRDSKPHAGQFSLRVRFGGAENLSYENIAQKSVLGPGRYRFQAYVRSEELTTDQGVFFQVRDFEDSGRLSAETEQVRGTTDWHMLAATFAVSRAAEPVVVTVERRRSWKFDNQIKGTLWIDQVSLTREE